MTTIQLNRVWKLGSRLADGGFGSVYAAKADDGSPAVVKLIPKAPGASRELLFGDLSRSVNVIPIIDSGEWDNCYVLVMPRAEKSLRTHLQDSGGRLDVHEAVAVLLDVAESLASLETAVVHRDIKPDNVLLYQGHWCLADFGIARYVEASTAPDTRKFYMTHQYAAPEQWREERATNATDIYSFGIMAFELLEGRLPFPGPDFRHQHLNEPAPRLSCSCPRIASLISECLFKAAAARPTSASVLSRLRSDGRQPSPAAQKLQGAQKHLMEIEAVEAAKASARRSMEESRADILESGKSSLAGILKDLRDRVLEAAPASRVAASLGRVAIELGPGRLLIDPVQAAPSGCIAEFDVIGYTAIEVRKARDRHGYEGRSHSLWLCDAHDEGVYRWFESAFMITPGIPRRSSLDPFALEPLDEYVANAFAPVMDVLQIAWLPVPIDQGDEEEFIERWLAWFAAAADGTLAHPSSMPEPSGGRYRRRSPG